jgi:hypothetical protein
VMLLLLLLLLLLCRLSPPATGAIPLPRLA